MKIVLILKKNKIEFHAKHTHPPTHPHTHTHTHTHTHKHLKLTNKQ